MIRLSVPGLLALALLLTQLAGPAAAQSEERPILIHFERTLEDAEAVSRATGRPLLICANMDGEPASEQFANRKYRSRRFADLVECYVPVIASPNRHNPRDRDEHGRRILCPRFGSVTCGEHLAVDPPAFERYFRGERVAPRHLGVDLSGAEPVILFDRFLDQDLTRVDRALASHATGDCGTLARLLASDANADQTVLEARYLDGGARQRREVLEAAAQAPTCPFDLLVLGLYEEDGELGALAVNALAKTAEEPDVERLVEMAKTASDPGLHARLDDALRAMRDGSTAARRYTAMAQAVDPEREELRAWIEALERHPEPEAEPITDEERLFEKVEALGAQAGGEGAPAVDVLELAGTMLQLAEVRLAAGRDPSMIAADAGAEAKRASQLGAPADRAAAVLARAAWIEGDSDTAGSAAPQALPAVFVDPSSPVTSRLLEVLARTRTQAIYDAQVAGEEWPVEWLQQADFAWRALNRHPLAQSGFVRAHADLLAYLGLARVEAEVLHDGLARFRTDADLHLRFRAHVERTRGVLALGEAYEELVTLHPDDASLRWFAGYARLIVAEAHVRAGDRASAPAAYQRAARDLAVSAALNPDYETTAAHFIAISHSGRARVALDEARLAEACDEILAAALRSPTSLTSADGMGNTGQGTLLRLRATLAKADERSLEDRLEESLAPVIPEIWHQTAP